MGLKLLALLAVTILGFGLVEGIEVEFGSGTPPLELDYDLDVAVDTYETEYESSGSEPVESGSGGPLFRNTKKPNVKCDETDPLTCYCVYDDGSKVTGTEAYAKKPDCTQYTGMQVVETTTTAKTSPTRSIDEEDPVADVDRSREREGMGEDSSNDSDIVIEYEVSTKEHPKTTTTKPTRQTHHRTTKAKDVSEEQGNGIAGNNDAVQKDDISVDGVYISHPGILAAIIGGAVVGLLCAILLVMFIVYRMRKKDEGSYPLNDSKPLRDYAYSKAPSKEFYA